jgi:hypothetical protein
LAKTEKWAGMPLSLTSYSAPLAPEGVPPTFVERRASTRNHNEGKRFRSTSDDEDERQRALKRHP